MVTPHARQCSPEFTYLCEMDFACTYALSQPDLAYDCAITAMDAAVEAGRPDLAYYANELAGKIGHE